MTIGKEEKHNKDMIVRGELLYRLLHVKRVLCFKKISENITFE